MAQALFSGHPVEEYLREETGEVDSLVPFLPGIHPAFDQTTYPLPPWDLRFLAPAFSVISVTVREEQRVRKAAEEFAERFKYILVSSTLLSTDLSAPHLPPYEPPRPFQQPTQASPSDTQTPVIPGNISQFPAPVDNQEDNEDELEPTEEFSFLTFDYGSWSQTLPPFPVIACIIILVLRFPFILVTISLLAIPLLPINMSDKVVPRPEEAAYTETIDFLSHLIEASQAWNLAVTTALSIIPNTPPSASSFAHPLAHSLHTTLSETTSRVTTIRSLLSALARSPRELRMLETMYGPRSPSPGPRVSFERSQESHFPSRASQLSRSQSARVSSYAHERTRSVSHSGFTSSTPTESRLRPMSLVQPGSILQSPTLGSGTMPNSPRQTALYRSSSAVSFRTTSSSIAPDLSDTRRYSETVPSSPLTRYTPRRRTNSKNSRSPNVRNSLDRDTFSTSALTALRDQARGSIRHTASCLLCLRFLTSDSPSLITTLLRPPRRASLYRQISSDSLLDSSDDEMDDMEPSHGDPSYWEDVRSVLALFRAALEDASDRLNDSISRFQATSSYLPSPPSSPPVHPVRKVSIDIPNLVDGRTSEILSVLRRRSQQETSSANTGFAPMPGSLTRFVRHIEAMEEALKEAQASLHETVELISREKDHQENNLVASHSPRLASVLNTYDGVRQALGVALRECERGRSPLSEHLTPPVASDAIPEEDYDAQRPDTPPLVEDDGRSDSVDSGDILGGTQLIAASDSSAMIIEGNPSVDPQGAPIQQLLTEAFLPIPQGKEQVYEAETSSRPFVRERPTLSREERIKLAKARREAAATGTTSTAIAHTVTNSESGSGPRPLSEGTGLGPGVEVVQELKDAIWQVGERRKRLGMSAGANSAMDVNIDVTGPPSPPQLLAATTPPVQSSSS